MTVTNRKAHPVLTSLQTLLQPDVDPAGDGDTQQTAAILTNKVATSLNILATTPSLHSLALEVVANALVFQISNYNALSYDSKEDEPLSGQLNSVWMFLDEALNHCPQGWAGVLFKWCVRLLGRCTQVQSSPTSVEEAIQKWFGHSLLAPVHAFLNKCTSLLVESGKAVYCMETLFLLCQSHAPTLSWLLAHIVSQYPSQMIPTLLDHTLSYPFPHTITPSQPTPHIFTTLTQALMYLSHTHRDILKQAVVASLSKILEGGVEKSTAVNFSKIRMLLVVATHCPPMTQFVAMDCLEFVTSSKIRRFLTNGDKVTPTKRSPDSHVTVKEEEEEDEGEILSDEEDMEQEAGNKNEGPPAIKIDEVVSLISGLLGKLRGEEASRALNCVMDVYVKTTVYLKTQEEPVEEGEIVHESPLESVVDGCRRIMSDFLSRLHSSTCLTHLTPQGHSSTKSGASGVMGAELDLVVSLQCGLLDWAEKFLELFNQDSDCAICITWLQELITCVSTCSSELVAGRVLAHLLLNCKDQSQLLRVLEIYWEVHTRHPHLTDTAIKAALSILHRTSPSHFYKIDSSHFNGDINDRRDKVESDIVVCFVRNMLTVLEHIDSNSTRNKFIRSAFVSALSDQVLTISHLLTTSLSDHTHPRFIVTIELLASILIGRSKTQTNNSQSSQTVCMLLQILLSSFFSLLKEETKRTLESGQSDVTIELCLGKCRHLIGWCTSGSSQSKDSHNITCSARMLAYSTVTESVLSEETSCYFSKQKLSQAQISGPFPSPASHTLLLTDSRNLRLSSFYRLKFNSREIRHSGTLSSRQIGYNRQNHGDYLEIAVIGNTSHLIQLLQAIAGPDHHQPLKGVASTTAVPIPGLSSGGKDLDLSADGLSYLMMDLVAPLSTAELQYWPDEDSLKYSLERDLAIKRKFDENPILWHFLLLLSVQNGRFRPLVVCASLIHSLLTMLTQHWQRCRSDKVSLFPRELESSVLLMECLAKASWLPPPLSFVHEIFPSASTQEVYLLLTAVNTFIKDNFKLIQTGDSDNYTDTGCGQLIKSTLLNNIRKLGVIYPRFINKTHSKTS